ncbi:spore germination protein YaaH [Paenibacillus phyllosphaerae]|uniref:Spore germination protein YaaH n=1 Tax=Paenibacillus phyllosphaerae TaxID=274593 RepID=A0A7W5AX35_9BACL|nr:glycosyl hydrolase family 18 protein [Paenibacillus phyllosphaerae]MBB3110400.1 spore germination protein YaaH [Paenibacillus phyllosphaerae]
MKNKWSVILAAALALQTTVTATASAGSAIIDKSSQYRVYQNDKAIKEFTTEGQAIAYAKNFSYAHVEKITNRVWTWDNLPKYKVYSNGISSASKDFQTLAQAQAYAKTLKFAQIRDLQQSGWVYATYAKYQLYQGDKTNANWSFASLAQAKAVAKYYGNMHVIDLTTNQWVWDNLTAAQKTSQRAGAKSYTITVAGEAASNTHYSYLQDAIAAAAKISGSSVVNVATGVTVHQNVAPFTVTQNGRSVKSFFNLENAIYYARSLAGSAIVKDGKEWWTNTPYLKVVRDDQTLGTFHTRQAAVYFASNLQDSVVMTSDGRAIWNNLSKMTYYGWNGTSNTNTVLSQVANTQGLDTTSPTWFVLTNADGSISDNSDPAVVTQMKASGIAVEPLVHNQFDNDLTRAFLKNPAAQTKFINTLVNRLVELGVPSMNLDFEGLYGGDRALYTEFVRDLTEALHKKGLQISVDLPRGDVAWNAQTAYDQAALGQIVDKVMIMAYDEHWSGSTEPGSVGGLAWIEEGVQQYLSYGIPRSKLVLGIPFYVRQWQLDGSGKLVGNKAIYMKEVPSLIAQNNAKGVLDAESGQMKYTYTKDGYTYVFWAETASTVKARVAIAKKYDLAGVAAWRLGYESEDLWTMLLQTK